MWPEHVSQAWLDDPRSRASINELIRQRNARATVDSYEDILGGAASAVCQGIAETRLPTPGFLRLNTNGGVTTPVLEGRINYVAGDGVYEL